MAINNNAVWSTNGAILLIFLRVVTAEGLLSESVSVSVSVQSQD